MALDSHYCRRRRRRLSVTFFNSAQSTPNPALTQATAHPHALATALAEALALVVAPTIDLDLA